MTEFINTILCDTKYQAHEAPSNGDCFFYCVAWALQSIHKKVTVQMLRSIVATFITEEIYQETKKVFEAVKKSKEWKLFDQVAYMANVRSLDDMKEVIQSQNFWANELAISILESVLKVKLIIVSTEAFMAKEWFPIRNAPLFHTDKGPLAPKAYIILVHHQDHYNLVSYDGCCCFLTIEDLPPLLVHEIRKTSRFFNENVQGWAT